jgi:hypothetical protein
MKVAACNKDLLTYSNVLAWQTAIQYAPSFFKDPKCTLYILSDTLEVCGEVTLVRVTRLSGIRANSLRPLQIPVVANEIRTSIGTNLTILIIILPPSTTKPPSMNLSHFQIQLKDLFVIPRSKHRTKNAEDATIVVGDTLEAKSRLALFPFCHINIPSRTLTPLDVHHIH